MFPYLLSLVMDKLTNNVQDKAHWSMMYLDDMVLVDENVKVLDGKIGTLARCIGKK